MAKQEFPKWVYFLDAAGKPTSKLINGPSDMKKEYVESPADLPTAEQADAVDEAPVDVPVVPVVPDAVKKLAADAQAELDAFYKAPATIIAGKVKKMDSLTDLTELRELEDNRPGGARPTVQRAIIDRMQALLPSDPEDAPAQ